MLLTSLVPFLKSQALKEFCLQHNKRHVTEIHTSFINIDRFRALIHKQRLLYFLKGRDIHGVVFKYHIKHERNPDINILLTCFKPILLILIRLTFKPSLLKVLSGMWSVSIINRLLFL